MARLKGTEAAPKSCGSGPFFSPAALSPPGGAPAERSHPHAVACQGSPWETVAGPQRWQATSLGQRPWGTQAGAEASGWVPPGGTSTPQAGPLLHGHWPGWGLQCPNCLPGFICLPPPPPGPEPCRRNPGAAVASLGARCGCQTVLGWLDTCRRSPRWAFREAPPLE